MNVSQATLILQMLEFATEGRWNHVSDHFTSEEMGYTPAEIIGAWKSLESVARVSGTAPTEEDF